MQIIYINSQCEIPVQVPTMFVVDFYTVTYTLDLYNYIMRT
jgi:hypothetical protein